MRVGGGALEVRDGGRGRGNGARVGGRGMAAEVGKTGAGGREVHAEGLLPDDADVLAPENVFPFRLRMPFPRYHHGDGHCLAAMYVCTCSRS